MTTTTDSPRRSPRVTGTRPLLVAAVAVVTVGLVVVLVAALTGGGDAASPALVGTVVAGAVLLSGTLVVNVVASVMPAASLMIAMMTYLLQVVLMGVVFLALAKGPLGETQTSREWLAGAVIACTMAWMAAQVVSATRARIPVYDLEQPATAHQPDGGDR